MSRLRLAGAVMGGLITLLAGALYVQFERTPAALLGHANPHARGAAAVAQRALAATDGQIERTSAPLTPAPSPRSTLAPPPARHGTWIEIPALGIALPLQRGNLTGQIPLWRALVYPGTVWPGEPGNSYIYAHGQWGMFAALLDAQVGDVAYVHDYDTHAVETFHVSRVIGKISYSDTAWITYKTTRPTLTLQTCVDWNPQGDRFLVQLT